MKNEFDGRPPWPFGGGAAPTRGAAARVGVVVQEPETSTLLPDRDPWERKHDRVAGPFDGCRVGLLETPVRIYDLSLGGCFVTSTHDQQAGSRVILQIDLPKEGWTTVNGETVYRRQGFGFGVRFVDVDAETTARLIRTIDALKERQGLNG
jgi:hypothetical protein